MPVSWGEYHPQAACLMYRGCRDPELVRQALEDLAAQWRQIGRREAAHEG